MLRRCSFFFLLLYIFWGVSFLTLCEASAIKWALELGRLVWFRPMFVSIVCTLLYQREIIKVQPWSHHSFFRVSTSLPMSPLVLTGPLVKDERSPNINLGCNTGNSSASLSLSWLVMQPRRERRHQDAWHGMCCRAACHATCVALRTESSPQQTSFVQLPRQGRTIRVVCSPRPYFSVGTTKMPYCTMRC